MVLVFDIRSCNGESNSIYVSMQCVNIYNHVSHVGIKCTPDIS